MRELSDVVIWLSPKPASARAVVTPKCANSLAFARSWKFGATNPHPPDVWTICQFSSG